MAKKLLVIGGPTASGKTNKAIQLAKKYQTEILSADSRQCYTELGIAVAKPSLDELKEVKHHFIDSHSIHQPITAGDYERYALEVLNSIFATHDVAVCVGGTGLYIKALCEGLDDMPKENQAIKLEVEKSFDERGLTWLQEEVRKADPVFISKVDANNYMRLLRALIFYRSNGYSILEKQLGQAKARPFEIEYYCTNVEREELYERINKRVDAMVMAGLVEEARNLYSLKGLTTLNTVGYQELFDCFDGKFSQEKAIEKIKQHTRNYAKRQITWFKNQGSFKNANTLNVS
jgi:tRNA dimethylallyltransferase